MRVQIGEDEVDALIVLTIPSLPVRAGFVVFGPVAAAAIQGPLNSRSGPASASAEINKGIIRERRAELDAKDPRHERRGRCRLKNGQADGPEVGEDGLNVPAKGFGEPEGGG